MIKTFESCQGAKRFLNSIAPDEIIPFSTNRMNDRGKVFYCNIAQNGEATVFRTETWSGMRFADSQHRVGDVLGIVVPERVCGSLIFSLSIKNEYGNTILRQGRG